MKSTSAVYELRRDATCFVSLFPCEDGHTVMVTPRGGETMEFFLSDLESLGEAVIGAMAAARVLGR